MAIIKGKFDLLHFTESCLSPPIIKGRDLHIPAPEIHTMYGYPLSGPISAVLIFYNVSSSVRYISEYIGPPENPSGFKPAYYIHDGPFEPEDGPQHIYSLEGFMEYPAAWIGEWVIKASDFALMYSDAYR